MIKLASEKLVCHEGSNPSALTIKTELKLVKVALELAALWEFSRIDANVTNTEAEKISAEKNIEAFDHLRRKL